MIEIAKALSSNPRILILDEPTAPLGQRESAQLFAAIARMKAQGVALLYVSHRFAEVLAALRPRHGAPQRSEGDHHQPRRLDRGAAHRRHDRRPGRALRRHDSRRRQRRSLEVTGLRIGTRVRDVSFVARRGEVLALTGLLGAGQNEIARAIGGDLRADGGTIAKDGAALTLRTPHDAVQARICLLTEERKHESILPNRPLRENIAVASLAARRHGPGLVDTAAERAAVEREVRDFGVVAASIEVPMRTLSGGNQQKAMIARWDLADADVFVLVEPTRGVDVGARADIYRRLDALARAGKAILLVSSDLPEVLALADRILVVRDGAITGEASPSDLDEEGLNLMIQGAAAA